MNEGSMGRAIYNFTSAVEGEISLRVGEVVQIHRKVDNHWYYGNHAGRLGNFPASYIVEIFVPSFKDEQRVFVASQPFNSNVPGDLSFDREEIIIGLSRVDSNWWNGSCDGRVGIFPLTHVWEADTSSLKNYASAKKVRKKARVKLDLKAQLDEEIDLKKGDVVTITEMVDKDWCRGECNGKTGIFPASFVIILDDEEPVSLLNTSANSSLTTIHKQATQSSANFAQSSVFGTLNDDPCARTLFAFTPQYSSELGFEAGDTVTLVRHVDSEWLEGKIGNNTGIFPKSYVEIVVDCPHVAEKENHFTEVNHSVITNNSHVEVISGQTQAQVLYDYFAQTEGDLTLVEDELITIFRQLNPDWFEAIDCQGNFGLCPANYLKLLPNKHKPQLAKSGSEGSELSTSDSWELMSNSMLNTSESNSSINKSNLSSNDSFVIVPETSSWHPPQFNEPNKPPPLPPRDSCKKSYNQDDFLARTTSNVTSDALDKSILRNLNNLDLTLTSSSPAVTASRKKFPERSQSFNETVYRDQRADFFSHLRQEPPQLPEPLVPNVPRQRAGSLYLSRPPPRPPPPAIKKDIKNTVKPVRPTTIPFLKTLKEDVTDSDSSVPLTGRSSNFNGQHAHMNVNGSNVLENRPTRKAPSPPRTAPHSSSQDKTVLVPHRPAPPIPYSSRFSSSSRGVREFASQRRESTGTTVRFRNRMHESNVIENDSSQQTKQLPEFHHGSTRPRSLSMGLDSRGEGVCLANESEGKSHKENNMEQRQMVINELLQTEQTYIRDLRLCTSTFLQNPEEAKAKGIDVDVVFGNLMEVVDVSEKLYTSLTLATAAASDQILIGPCFQNLEEKMKQAYGHYCANHADSIHLLEKYQDNLDIQHYFSKKMEIINSNITCLNLNALLIKPVQRILKYPLLLDALIKCTDDDHEDKIELEKTMQLMLNLAGFVNEFKRRKDIVSKYLKDEDTSLSAMLSKLNLHSVMKKSTRIGMRLSTSIGLTSVTKDEVFDEEEHKFHALEKTIRCFEKDVTVFCAQLEEWAKTQFELSEGVASFYMEECRRVEVERFRNVQRELFAFIFADLKKSVGNRVATPLKTLILTFSGPAKLIDKRYDKLLDYDNSTHRLEKNKDGSKSSQLREEHDLVKKNYEALNSQLIEELPKLFNVALAIFQDCVREFLAARKRFIGRFVKEMLPLAELPQLLNVQDDVLDEFQSKHAQAIIELQKLSFIPKNLFPSKLDTKEKVDKNQRSRSKSPRHSQTEEVRNKVLSSYPKHKVYMSTSLYEAKDEFEISMHQGDILGVIMEKDPMGLASRWFVDNGVAKGFVPSTYLTLENSSNPAPLVPAPVRRPSVEVPKVTKEIETPLSIKVFEPEELVSTDRYDIPFESPERYDFPCDDDISSDRYDFPTEELASPQNTDGANSQHSANSSPTAAAAEYYYAAYEFIASTNSELSLQNGQTVLVKQKEDMDGNPEWWLVQDRFKNKGFAPANYLRKYCG